MITPQLTNLLSTNDRTIVDSSTNHSHQLLVLLNSRKKLHQRNRKPTKNIIIPARYKRNPRSQTRTVSRSRVFREETLSCQTMFPRSLGRITINDDVTAYLINALRYEGELPRLSSAKHGIELKRYCKDLGSQTRSLEWHEASCTHVTPPRERQFFAISLH